MHCATARPRPPIVAEHDNWARHRERDSPDGQVNGTVRALGRVLQFSGSVRAIGGAPDDVQVVGEIPRTCGDGRLWGWAAYRVVHNCCPSAHHHPQVCARVHHGQRNREPTAPPAAAGRNAGGGRSRGERVIQFRGQGDDGCERVMGAGYAPVADGSVSLRRPAQAT